MHGDMEQDGMTGIVVAIDGPAASGKSSVAKSLAARTGFQHVNSGLMYRAATRAVLEEGIAPGDVESVIGFLVDADVKCGWVGDEFEISIGGKVRRGLAEADVNQHVSTVAKVAAVRAVLVELQRRTAVGVATVMEGRDIGSVVFPETPYKFYVDASEEVRQKRRVAQGLADSIRDRDREDSTRKSSPLVIAKGAVVIDSSELTVDEVVERVVESLVERGVVFPGGDCGGVGAA
ncbi:MAG: (d)CMP kinase [Verrucomicrobiales bacterium]|nr:(d)CMP kinase [Verrucomicrobiales bacterium]